eukprot:scaffold61439_cov63-Phaeocystis_antarctica.AAC.1
MATAPRSLRRRSARPPAAGQGAPLARAARGSARAGARWSGAAGPSPPASAAAAAQCSRPGAVARRRTAAPARWRCGARGALGARLGRPADALEAPRPPGARR